MIKSYTPSSNESLDWLFTNETTIINQHSHFKITLDAGSWEAPTNIKIKATKTFPKSHYPRAIREGLMFAAIAHPLREKERNL